MPRHLPADIGALQQTDPDIQEVCTFWWQKHYTDREEHRQISPLALSILKQWDRLTERAGVVYRQVLVPDGGEVLLPVVLQERVLTEVNQNHGHQDVDRTLELLRQECYWPGLTADVIPMTHARSARTRGHWQGASGGTYWPQTQMRSWLWIIRC